MADQKRKTRAPIVGRREMAYLISLSMLLIIALGLILVFSDTDECMRQSETAAAWVELPQVSETVANPPGFEKVVDDSQYVTEGYFDLLKLVNDSAPQPEPVACTFYDLATRPKEFRGKFIEVRGRVLDIEPHLLERSPESSPRPASDRPSSVYQVELVVMQGQSNSVAEKYFLHTPQPPQKFAPGDEAVFRGYFYARYLGKTLKLRKDPNQKSDEIKVARVIAPLLVGSGLQHIKAETPIAPKLLVNLDGAGEIVDRDIAVSNSVLEAALNKFSALSSAEREGGATYFDMMSQPRKFSGCLARIKGEILSVEDYDANTVKFRRLIVRVDYGGLFQRLVAVYLGPDAPDIRVGATVQMDGVFVELLKLRGSTQQEQIVPMIVAADCEAAQSVSGSSTSNRFWLLIAALLAITVIAGVFFVCGIIRSRRRRLR